MDAGDNKVTTTLQSFKSQYKATGKGWVSGGGGLRKRSHEMGHHHKQAAVPAPSNSHPSIPRRVNTFLWDNPINSCTLHWYKNGLSAISEAGKHNLFTAAIFVFFPAASQGEMHEPPVFTSDTKEGEGN